MEKPPSGKAREGCPHQIFTTLTLGNEGSGWMNRCCCLLISFQIQAWLTAPGAILIKATLGFPCPSLPRPPSPTSPPWLTLGCGQRTVWRVFHRLLIFGRQDRLQSSNCGNDFFTYFCAVAFSRLKSMRAVECYKWSKCVFYPHISLIHWYESHRYGSTRSYRLRSINHYRP